MELHYVMFQTWGALSIGWEVTSLCWGTPETWSPVAIKQHLDKGGPLPPQMLRSTLQVVAHVSHQETQRHVSQETQFAVSVWNFAAHRACVSNIKIFPLNRSSWQRLRSTHRRLEQRLNAPRIYVRDKYSGTGIRRGSFSRHPRCLVWEYTHSLFKIPSQALATCWYRVGHLARSNNKKKRVRRYFPRLFPPEYRSRGCSPNLESIVAERGAKIYVFLVSLRRENSENV